MPGPFDNIFDGFKDVAFDIVTNVMGYAGATWTPSAGGPTLTGTVLFNNPTEDRKLAAVDYNPIEYRMEYKAGVFDGLKDSVDRNNVEQVVIRGVTFNVREVAKKYDGDTYIAKIDTL